MLVPRLLPCQAGQQGHPADVQLLGTLLDSEHADVLAVDLDYLITLSAIAIGEHAPLKTLVPPPDRLDVLAQCGPVQLIRPFQVGRRGWAQAPCGNVRGVHDQRMPQTPLRAAIEPIPIAVRQRDLPDGKLNEP